MTNGIEDVFGDGSDPKEGQNQPAAGTENTVTPAASPEAKATPAKKTRAKKATPAKATAKDSTESDGVKRVWIILQKTDEVPPSGLHLGHNGTGYLLKAGKKAYVPEFLLDILDNAVVKKPIIGDNGRVSGYEDSPRFPYQVVRGE